MLKMDSINFNGSSSVDENVIATFNATYNGTKDVYLSMAVADHELLAQHKATVDADFIAFKDSVLATLGAAE